MGIGHDRKGKQGGNPPRLRPVVELTLAATLPPRPNRMDRPAPPAAHDPAPALRVVVPPAAALRPAPHHRLAALARELDALGAELAALPALADAAGPVPGSAPAQPANTTWLDAARRAYRDRRSRAAMFGHDDLFGEPAWDLLLDLFIAAIEGKRVPVTSACIGAAVPTTTALRWLALLEDKGLVRREADTADARRVFVRLSPTAYAAMAAYFARAAGPGGEETTPSFLLRG